MNLLSLLLKHGLRGWIQIAIAIAGRIAPAVVVAETIGCSAGRLCADATFDGRQLYADVTVAKATSGIDLYAVGTNLWESAVEGHAGKFIIRAALDKTHYQLGEPIHLFL